MGLNNNTNPNRSVNSLFILTFSRQVSTATQGVASTISYFGDEQFVQMRAEKHRRATDAAREGVLSGLMEGGESLITGLASGVTGLFSRPIEGALQNGPTGFVRGIGIGVVGVAVGPVLGVADGFGILKILLKTA